MKKIYLFICSLTYLLLLHASRANAQTQTVGLFTHLSGSEDDGYVLFAPVDGSDTTYLIDKCGRWVHKWAGNYSPGFDVYLLPDGTLLKAGSYPNPVFDPSGVSGGGIIQRYDWDGRLLWEYLVSDTLETQDHDIYYMPNGHILVAIWEVISDSEAIANGRDPSTLPAPPAGLWSAKIEEIQPVGTNAANIVWTWRAWDHLIQDYDSTKLNYGVVANHPELLNLNYTDYTYTSTLSDWLHLNQVTYNPTLNQVMVSFHNLNEIYIIDHSTDSVQAASHSGGTHNKGGDFLYRWGNPAAYGRGTTTNQKLYQQHDPTWITAGKYANQIMIFNNGYGRPGGNASSVDIINPPVDSSGNYYLPESGAYGPDSLTWTYENPIPEDFFTDYMGGAQILPNGNTLVCQAEQGKFFEIDSAKIIQWEYVNPINNGTAVSQGTILRDNAVYRCTFYQSSYIGFTGDTIPAGIAPLELNPLSYSCEVPILATSSITNQNNPIEIFPNPADNSITIKSGNLQSATLMDITGRVIVTGQYDNNTSQAEINTASLPDGVYIVCVNATQYHRIVVRH